MGEEETTRELLERAVQISAQTRFEVRILQWLMSAVCVLLTANLVLDKF